MTFLRRLRCAKGAGGVLDFDRVSASTTDGLASGAPEVSVSIYNLDGSLFSGPFATSDTSPAVTKIALDGVTTWTYDPANAAAIAVFARRFSVVFNGLFRLAFTEVGPGITRADIWATVNDLDTQAKDYPGARVFADGYNGYNNPTWSTGGPEYGCGMQTNPLREMRQIKSMMGPVGSSHIMVRGQMYGVRTQSFANARIEGWPFGVLQAKGGNTVELGGCYLKDITLGGLLGGTYNGNIKMERGAMDGAIHGNGTLQFIDGTELRGTCRFLSTTRAYGTVLAPASVAVIRLGNSMVELTFRLMGGVLQLNEVKPALTANVIGMGATVQLWTANTTTGTVNVAGHIPVTRSDGAPWDGSPIGGVTVVSNNVTDANSAVGVVQAGLTAQGYTSTRAGFLDRLDAAVSSVAASVWGHVLDGTAWAVGSAGRWVQAIRTELGIFAIWDAGAGDGDGVGYDGEDAPDTPTTRKAGYPDGTDLAAIPDGAPDGGPVGGPTPEVVTVTDAVLDVGSPQMPKTIRTRVL